LVWLIANYTNSSNVTTSPGLSSHVTPSQNRKCLAPVIDLLEINHI